MGAPGFWWRPWLKQKETRAEDFVIFVNLGSFLISPDSMSSSLNRWGLCGFPPVPRVVIKPNILCIDFLFCSLKSECCLGNITDFPMFTSVSYMWDPQRVRIGLNVCVLSLWAHSGGFQRVLHSEAGELGFHAGSAWAEHWRFILCFLQWLLHQEVEAFLFLWFLQALKYQESLSFLELEKLELEEAMFYWARVPSGSVACSVLTLSGLSSTESLGCSCL